MPTSANPDALVDTSVAVPVLVINHPDHRRIAEAVSDRSLGLSGHAAFETFSVITRLPPSQRLTASDAYLAIVSRFPGTRALGADAAAAVLRELADQAITGGAVYDALVGAAAREHGFTLITRDVRAVGTYRALGVDVELIR